MAEKTGGKDPEAFEPPGNAFETPQASTGGSAQGMGSRRTTAFLTGSTTKRQEGLCLEMYCSNYGLVCEVC